MKLARENIDNRFTELNRTLRCLEDSFPRNESENTESKHGSFPEKSVAARGAGSLAQVQGEAAEGPERYAISKTES